MLLITYSQLPAILNIQLRSIYIPILAADFGETLAFKYCLCGVDGAFIFWGELLLLQQLLMVTCIACSSCCLVCTHLVVTRS